MKKFREILLNILSKIFDKLPKSFLIILYKSLSGYLTKTEIESYYQKPLKKPLKKKIYLNLLNTKFFLIIHNEPSNISTYIQKK